MKIKIIGWKAYTLLDLKELIKIQKSLLDNEWDKTIKTLGTDKPPRKAMNCVLLSLCLFSSICLRVMSVLIADCLYIYYVVCLFIILLSTWL